MAPLKRDALAALLALLAATAYFHFVRGYPYLLAAMAGASIGALVFAVGRTVERLRELGRSDSDREE